MILSTNDELNSKFLFLANYTDQAVANIDNHLTAEMDTLEQEQNNANLVLEAEDEKLSVSLNQTQVKIQSEIQKKLSKNAFSIILNIVFIPF